MCARCTRIWCVRPVSSLRAHERVGAEALAHAVVRDRRAPVLAHRHAQRSLRCRPIGAIDRAAGRHHADADASYCALDLARLRAARTSAVCASACARRPAGRSCPCRAGARGPRAARARAPDRSAAARSAACRSRLPAPGMHDEAGRLVDHDERCVLRARRRARSPAAATRLVRLELGLDTTRSPPCTMSRGSRRAPVDPHRPASIQSCRRVRE